MLTSPADLQVRVRLVTPGHSPVWAGEPNPRRAVEVAKLVALFQGLMDPPVGRVHAPVSLGLSESGLGSEFLCFLVRSPHR